MIVLLPLSAVGADTQLCTRWGEAFRVGELDSALNEASGLAISRQFPGRLYHINDSGDTGRFYITDMKGKATRAVRVAGFDPQDTEALSLGRCPRAGQRSCLFIADIGDNNSRRKFVEIVIVEEMQNLPAVVKPVARLKLKYPDRPHDAESLAVHPDGSIFVLTKDRPAQLFKADPGRVEQTLTPVTTIDPGGKPTDMAISDDGSRVLVLTYNDAVEYTIDFKDHRVIKVEFLQQQESIAYLPGSRSFLYTTERLLPFLPQWIMRVDCPGSQ